MFGHGPFFNDTIRKYIVLFGTLFNEIYLPRYNPDGSVSTMLRVPITYAPRDKAIARVEEDPNLDRPWSAMLPFMSFSLKSMYYDAERHLNKVNRVRGRNLPDKNFALNYYSPVPYTFNFELNVIAKNQQDAVRIVENIVPWFTPDWTTTIKVIDNPETLLDVPVVLNPITLEDRWQGSLEERRTIVYTLSFALLGYLYGPVRKDRIIKVVKARVGVEGSDRFDTVVTTTPGMTADGEPTNDPDETVPYSQIDWEDDFGFIQEVERNVVP